ncbi:MAG TPA: cytochrome c3 family protein, partial [Mycobacterium sp.]
MTRPSPACRISAGAVLRGLLVSAALAAALLLAGAAHAASAAAAAAAGSTIPMAAPAAAKLDPNIDPHGPYTITTDRCAMCHRAHTGDGASMITEPTQSQLCLTCHDGTGAAQNVAGEYSAVPQNVPATRAYFRHDATAADAEVGHTLSVRDEFTGVE